MDSNSRSLFVPIKWISAPPYDSNHKAGRYVCERDSMKQSHVLSYIDAVEFSTPEKVKICTGVNKKIPHTVCFIACCCF